MILLSCNSTGTDQIPAGQAGFKLEGVNSPSGEHGMDADILSSIQGKMGQFVDSGKISGAVTLVARNGSIAHFEAAGFRDLGSGAPMEKNTLFRIASMTKPFVAAAIMMQVEEGSLSLDDPVKKHLPEFSGMWLTDNKSEGRLELIRPSRPINIRDILRHTSGLGYVPRNMNVKSIRENSMVASRLPLQFEPGSRWQYGGEGIHAAARIVEVLSGMSYCDFLTEKMFKPLGMNDTYFHVPDSLADRVATLYRSGDNGQLVAIESYFGPGYFRPDGGLVSNAPDMAIWMQTMLDGGIYRGSRILSEESVREMIKIQTGELECGFTDGMSFGLAFGIVREPQGVSGMLSHGTFGHGGAFGTNYWADPVTGTLYILMIQRTGFGNADDSDIRKVFQETAASAINH